MERVRFRQSVLKQATRELAEANAAIDAHHETARSQEDAGLSQIVGKTISCAEMLNFHLERLHHAYRLEELRYAEKLSEKKRDEAQVELKSAAALFRERHRSVEKFDYLLSDLRRGDQKKSLALSETGLDEFHKQNTISIPAKQPQS